MPQKNYGCVNLRVEKSTNKIRYQQQMGKKHKKRKKEKTLHIDSLPKVKCYSRDAETEKQKNRKCL